MKRNRLTLFALAVIVPVLLLVLATAVFPPTAHAAPTATITVNTLADENNSDGDCSLREAIAAANTDAVVDACTQGSGYDTIDFNIVGGGTIILTQGYLIINSPITIDGGNEITVSGGGTTKIFHVGNVSSPATPSNGRATFANLTITGGNGDSPAIGLPHSTSAITVTNSTIAGNSGSLAGAIFSYQGKVVINNSTVSGNTSSNWGGAINTNGGIIEINNSTLSGNTATAGGGATNNYGGTVTIRNSSIISNTSPQGGIRNEGNLTFINTIVANNTNVNCHLISGTVTSGASNLANDASCTGFVQVADAKVGSLQDNGGPTLTHALLTDSPAIGAGDCTSGPATDQRGAARPQDDTCDVGAFELPPPTCLAGSYSNGVSCVLAPAGYYVPADGATSYVACSLGTYQPDPGAVSCLDAPVNTFVGFEGASTPTPCAPHFYTWVPASTSCQAALTVTTLVDENDGECAVDCSLRDAIILAMNDDTIDFAVSGTIVLGSELVINRDLTVYGNMPITVSGNNAVRVFYISAGTVTIDGLTIANGAALAASDEDCQSNSRQCGGGIMIDNNSVNLTVRNSLITNNQTQQWGGGIANDGGTLTLINSTVSGNTSHYLPTNYYNIGGGILSDGGTTTLLYSTITDNFASNGGGGIKIIYGGTLQVAGTILAGNTINYGSADCESTDTVTNNGNNFVGVASCGFTASGNPLLGSLANNGGPTLTHALLTGSPAIDAGDCTSGPAIDQRGAARPQDATCDIGAYEETGTLQCSVAAGNSYTFPNQSGVSILINSTGDLDCLYMDELPFNHPNATGLTNGANLKTGKYWQIRGLQADGTTPATTFNVDLTLPYATASASTRACKWLDGVGPGFGWNCEDGIMGTSFAANSSVTRLGVTEFSQWAVGDNVGPTAVSLQSISATNTTVLSVLLLVLLVMGGLTAVYTHRRTR